MHLHKKFSSKLGLKFKGKEEADKWVKAVKKMNAHICYRRVGVKPGLWTGLWTEIWTGFLTDAFDFDNHFQSTSLGSTEQREVNLSLLLEHRFGEVPWLIEMENNRLSFS